MKLHSKFLQRFLFFHLKLFHWKRKVVEDNLDIVHSGISKLSKKKFYFLLLKSLTRSAANFLTRSQIYSPSDPRFLVDEKSVPVLEKMKRGGLMLTAHLGNYEAIGPWLVRMGIPLTASYAKIHPKFLDKWVQSKLRSVDSFNYSLFINNPKIILRLLDKGKLFCLLADQDYRKSRFTPGKFLNQSVHCNPIPQFILRHRPQTPVYLCWLESNGDSFTLFAKELSSQNGSFVFEQFHQWLELQIKKNPEKWYGWFHRRFLSSFGNKVLSQSNFNPTIPETINKTQIP